MHLLNVSCGKTNSRLPVASFTVKVIFLCVQLEKTKAELTRALHRLYELEQELTFYKIDTKLSPLPPCREQVTTKAFTEWSCDEYVTGKCRIVLIKRLHSSVIRRRTLWLTVRTSAGLDTSGTPSPPLPETPRLCRPRRVQTFTRTWRRHAPCWKTAEPSGVKVRTEDSLWSSKHLC